MLGLVQRGRTGDRSPDQSPLGPYAGTAQAEIPKFASGVKMKIENSRFEFFFTKDDMNILISYNKLS